MISSINSDSHQCFKDFEAAFKTTVPISLKNVLVINGYDTPAALQRIQDHNIIEIEDFLRTKLHTLIPNDEYKFYYGLLFALTPVQYRMVSGHKEVIYAMKNYFQNRHKSNKSTMTDLRMTSEKAPRKCSSKPHSKPPLDVSKVDLLAEDVKLFNILKKWAECKFGSGYCSTMNFDSIKIKTRLSPNNELFCTITCLCGVQYNIAQFPRRDSLGDSSTKARWVYANFQSHFTKKHGRSRNTSFENAEESTSSSQNYDAQNMLLPEDYHQDTMKEEEFSDSSNHPDDGFFKEEIKPELF